MVTEGSRPKPRLVLNVNRNALPSKSSLLKAMPAVPIIPIVYLFVPHYRSGVNRALLDSRRYDYLFVGDLGGRAGGSGGQIEAWRSPKAENFLRVHNYYLGRALFQPRVVRLALRRDIRQIIFLGGAEYVSTWVAAAAARLTGKQVYFWTHGWTSRDVGLKKSCRLAFYRLANGMLLYGHHAKRIGIDMGFRAESMHVIYNSLDYPIQQAVRQAVRLEELRQVRHSLFESCADVPMLICTGRLIPMRRLELLLDAMRILKAAQYPVNLLLVGDGPEAEKLKANAQHNGLSVHFYGPCYDERTLGRLFMAADLLVMPGRVGLAAMHSLAYGTPVLIHDDPNDQGPEWEAVIPGYNGAYFAHNDSQDLARSLSNWLAVPRDTQQLHERCHEVIERFYNPAVQAALIERALDGKAADDSDWERFSASRRTMAAGLGISHPALVN